MWATDVKGRPLTCRLSSAEVAITGSAARELHTADSLRRAPTSRMDLPGGEPRHRGTVCVRVLLFYGVSRCADCPGWIGPRLECSHCCPAKLSWACAAVKPHLGGVPFILTFLQPDAHQVVWTPKGLLTPVAQRICNFELNCGMPSLWRWPQLFRHHLAGGLNSCEGSPIESQLNIRSCVSLRSSARNRRITLKF